MITDPNSRQSFGLFHAQKSLGHSTPMVTDAYYAGLTDIPELKTVQLKPSEDPAKDEDGEDQDDSSKKQNNPVSQTGGLAWP